ncbi:MAG: hypothetical protein N2053_05650, partial [Chitinispirillaceae bacterium]|nr:hypothetical protein [Chitinispirillaceae bacterium]
MIIDLNGKWNFRKVGTKKWYEATVPGCVHIDLYRNNLISDPFKGSNELELNWIEKTDFEYQRTFEIDEEFLKFKNIELVAEGLDTLATISINKNLVATTQNMFISYRFDIKKFLIKGENTITILFKNPIEYIKNYNGFKFIDQPNDPVGGSSVIRKMQCSFGWDWGPRLPTCGIYRPIRIEGRNFPIITHVYVKQIHLQNRVKLICYPQTSRHLSKEYHFRYSLNFGNLLIDSSLKNELTIDNPKLWWPNGYGEQPLYNLRVELFYKDTLVDIWYRQIGLRTIYLCCKEDKWGESFVFIVNDEKIYIKGASLIPPNIFPSEVTPETYNNILQSAVKAHFNMIRVWGGGLYEQDIFYDLCDKYGIMIWHDFMFSCSLYPFDKEFLSLVTKEAIYQVKRLAHHPSIALWCGNNEIEAIFKINETPEDVKKGYRYLFYNLLPQIVRKHSPHISYIPTSPYTPIKYEKEKRGGDYH